MEKILNHPPLNLDAQFLGELEKASKVEEKVRLCLNYMKQLLADDETPQFRQFWDTRSLCLELFKEKLAPRIRTVYWAEFVALSEEIRKVKEILDEQSSFAVEQIELAISSLKNDLNRLGELANEMDPIEVPQMVDSLKSRQEEYIQRQRELDLLGTLAGRLNSLRKELIHTNMRIRHKNRLFGELSKIGDEIFPLRKEGIVAISDLFSQDVESFHLDTNRAFEKKEEIKAFQAFAKLLTINAKTFAKTRESLSSFWDQIKEVEKQRHEIKAKERELFQESFDKIAPKIDLLHLQCEEERISWNQAQSQEENIHAEMRELKLGRDEVKALKKRLRIALEPLEKKRAQQLEKEKEEERLKKEHREKSQVALYEKLTELLDRAESLSFDTLVEKWEAFVKEEKALSPDGLSKERISSRLDAVYDHIQEKQWHTLQEDQSEEGVQKLHSLLDNRHKARRKLKESLEAHRKTVGGSSLSLEQSLLYQEMVGEEKLRLDAIETMIEELEERLFDVEE